MASSEPERSIMGGISLPQWMKSKITDRYDLEQSAFSPPTDDDGFFLIPYHKARRALEPASVSQEAKPKIVRPRASPQGQLPKVASEGFITATSDATTSLTSHTEPCQQFIPQAKITPREIGLKRGVVDPPLGKVKSTGTDDGFTGEGAACGYSVVAVAQQMLSEKDRSSSSDEASHLGIPRYERTRRNSKSLPASPQTSPKFLRKNPYFTNIFFGSTDSVDSETSLTKTSGSLLSAALELQKRSAMGAGVEGGALAASGATPKQLGLRAQSEEGRPLRAKPSQLREMNFWSPTSM